MQDQTAHSVQSDLDLHFPEKVNEWRAANKEVNYYLHLFTHFENMHTFSSSLTLN